MNRNVLGFLIICMVAVFIIVLIHENNRKQQLIDALAYKLTAPQEPVVEYTLPLPEENLAPRVTEQIGFVKDRS
jgi:hypothetical protein